MQDYRPTISIFVAHSILTQQYFIYDPMGKILHRSRDVVFGDGMWETAPNGADEAILNMLFYSDVIEELTPTKKPSQTWQPITQQLTERQTEVRWDNNSPLDPLHPKKKWSKLAGLKTSHRDACKRPASISHRNCAGKDTLAGSVQLALDNEELKNTIPIYTGAAFWDNYVDGINAMSYKTALESLLLEKCDTAIKKEWDTIARHQVFADFVELLKVTKALPSDWL